ncbi:hypothetical protein [Aquicoccus sp. SU-CL01552]|uniref:hypothetical protein n=1 Tax=Aquicoccus sp. SU-CL01552 TaxID=3127656 RepID=UPI0031081C51
MNETQKTATHAGRAMLTAGSIAVGLAMTLGSVARSEQPSTAFGASPLPAHVELRFCYYAGLAYSPGATISVEAPVRREIVTDTRRKILRCVSDGESTGRHRWQEVDPDAQDPFRN